jgi:hypothetical protein
LTEENVFKLHKDGVKVILYDKKVIKNIQNQINELKTSEEDCDVEVWLSVLVHYKNDETNYLSFTGYSNFSIIRYGGKCYEWKQELVELFYPYLPKYILDSLPDEIK